MRVGPLALLALAACSASEPIRRELPVVIDPSGLTAVETNLGWNVSVTEARLAVQNFSFTVAGEAHRASLLSPLLSIFIGAANAHPGHYQGGDVTGELRGHFVVDWSGRGGATLGTATLLAGRYESVNFTFARAAASDGLAQGDPLIGHTVLFRGRAEKAGKTVQFLFVLDSQEGRELVGAPFALEVRDTTAVPIGFRLNTRASLGGDTLFDDIDFGGLDRDGNGDVDLNPANMAGSQASTDAYNTLRRTLQTHDHFDFKPGA